MGKTLEIIPASKLREKLPQLLNTEMDVIFKNGTVIHGNIVKIEGDTIRFKDKIFNKHVFSFSELEEVVLDK